MIKYLIQLLLVAASTSAAMILTVSFIEWINLGVIESGVVGIVMGLSFTFAVIRFADYKGWL